MFGIFLGLFPWDSRGSHWEPGTQTLTFYFLILRIFSSFSVRYSIKNADFFASFRWMFWCDFMFFLLLSSRLRRVQCSMWQEVLWWSTPWHHHSLTLWWVLSIRLFGRFSYSLLPPPYVDKNHATWCAGGIYWQCDGASKGSDWEAHKRSSIALR